MLNAKLSWRQAWGEAHPWGRNLGKPRHFEETSAGNVHCDLRFGAPEGPRSCGVGVALVF